MGLLLVIVGLGLVGYYLYATHEAESNDVPLPAQSKYLFGGGALACFVVAAYLFYNVGDALIHSEWTGFTYIVFSVALVVGGVKLAKAAYEADQREAEDMDARARAKASHAQHEANKIALENARLKAQQELLVQTERIKTEIAQLKARREDLDAEYYRRELQKKEWQLQTSLAEIGQKYGLTSNDVSAVNRKLYEGEIDLTHRWQQTGQDLQAADLIDSSQQRAIINQRRKELEDLLRERSRIDKKEKDSFVKERLLARYDKDIANLEEEIDGRQNRLVLLENRKETRRLT